MQFVTINSMVRKGLFTEKYPVKAGSCRVELVNTNEPAWIQRDTKKIFVPHSPEKNCDLFARLTSTSFLLRYENNGNLTFCGQDGDFPFATSLKPKALAIYQHGGWPRLERAMVPPDIRILAKSLGRNWQRSGDIFFLRIAKTFERAKKLVRACTRLVLANSVAEAINGWVFSTSHHFSGSVVLPTSRDGEVALVSGTLTAPDHPKVVLKHVCMLVPNALVDYSANAD